MFLNFACPQAWLVFQQLPEAFQQMSYHIEYKPVQAHSLGASSGSTPSLPPPESTELLLLALQTSQDGSINRYVADTVFQHVWGSGEKRPHLQQLPSLRQKLSIALTEDTQAHARAVELLAKNQILLQQQSIVSTPALWIGTQTFEGTHCLPMLRAYLLAASSKNATPQSCSRRSQ